MIIRSVEIVGGSEISLFELENVLTFMMKISEDPVLGFRITIFNCVAFMNFVISDDTHKSLVDIYCENIRGKSQIAETNKWGDHYPVNVYQQHVKRKLAHMKVFSYFYKCESESQDTESRKIDS